MINLEKSHKLFSLTFSLAIAMMTSLGAGAAWAGDPFRTTNPRDIDSKTEAAFIAIFREGNYKEARQFLDQATDGGSHEPLVYAMKASLYYDSANLEEMRVYADKTLQTAEKLKEKELSNKEMIKLLTKKATPCSALSTYLMDFFHASNVFIRFLNPKMRICIF
jgi:hypothetical protein